MAERDYILCESCRDRVIYDGDCNARDRLESQYITDKLTCPKCVERLRQKAEWIDGLREEVRALRLKYEIESDESFTETIERTIDGWKQRALKAEEKIKSLTDALAACGAVMARQNAALGWKEE